MKSFLQLLKRPLPISTGNTLKLLFPVLFCLASLHSEALTRTWIGYGSGGTAAKTDISAAANWSGGTALLATDDYVMTFSTSLGSGNAVATFILTQSTVLTFKSLTVSFTGNGNGLKKVVISSSKNLSVTNAFTITNSTNTGNADHEIDFNITAGTLTCGSLTLNANGLGGLFGYPQLFLNVSNGASLLCSGAFTANCSVSSYTTTSIENSGTITVNGPLTSNSAGFTQVLFDANAGGVYNMNGTVSLGTSGLTGVFLGTYAAGTSTGKFYFRNNLTFGALGFIDPLYNAQSYIFDGTGTQALSIGNSSVYFSNLIIGEVNSPVVNVSGTGNALLTANAASANLQLNNSAMLNLGTKTLNRTAAGGLVSLNNLSSLKLSGISGGQAGSNFPANFSAVSLSIGSTVEYNGINGSAQTIYATPSYGNLTLTNSSGAGTAAKTITSDASVRNALTLNDRISFTIPNGKSLTLKSDVSITARVAEIITPSTVSLVYGGTGAIKGKFIVERYISAVRGWRFLSVPTIGTELIHDAWQEGQAANNTSLVGKGIQLTSNVFPNGFDLYSASTSLKTYVPATNTWAGVASTLSPFDITKGGYLTFIRGDRTVNAYLQAPTSTVLRTSGMIYTGDRIYTLPLAGKFAAIGNPYPSAIDFTKIYAVSSGITEQFNVYDPKAGTPGIGGYQTITKIGGVWKAIPGGGSYPTSGPVNPYIESGQAFFVYSARSNSSLSIKENSKAGVSRLVSREPGTSGLQTAGLQTMLYAVNADGTSVIADGVYNEFDEAYLNSNSADELDAVKSINFGLNLSIRKNDDLLVVNRSQPLSPGDTIHLNLTGTRIQTYRFQFFGENLALPGLQAFLYDSYLDTLKSLSLADTSTIDFTIANIPGSYAPDRFRIVFSELLSPLPVNITDISAIINTDRTVSVSWKAENETSIENYEVERSADARNFKKINITKARMNNGGSASYNHIDANPLEPDNFYRVKAISMSGKVQYSAVVKVSTMKVSVGISVYPNPVVNKILNVQFNSSLQGNYQFILTNQLGQPVFTGTAIVNSSNTVRSFSIGSGIPAGNYQLSITAEDGTKTSQQVMVK